MKIFNWLKTTHKQGEPLKVAVLAADTNRVHNILQDLTVIGGRLLKPTHREGCGWVLIMDGSGYDDLPPGVTPQSLGVMPYPEPFDLVSTNGEDPESDGGDFALSGDGAGEWLWIAGASVARGDIEAADLAWVAASTVWTGSITETSYVWIELSRAPESTEEDAEIFVNAALPDGTAAKYQERAMIRPLWRLDYADGLITGAVDLRGSQHFGATA